MRWRGEDKVLKAYSKIRVRMESRDSVEYRQFKARLIMLLNFLESGFLLAIMRRFLSFLRIRVSIFKKTQVHKDKKIYRQTQTQTYTRIHT